MKRLCWAAALLLTVCLLVSGAAAAAVPAPVSVADLLASNTAFDGTVVTVQGEVVGDIMHRGTLTWVNVNDGTGTVGVWGPLSLFVDVSYAGAYAQRGDIVRVTGLFEQAAAHGGDLAIAAHAVERVATGGPLQRPISEHRLLLAAVTTATAALLGLTWLWRWRRLHNAGSGPV